MSLSTLPLGTLFSAVEQIRVTDVGAQYVESQPASYQPLVELETAHILGFEPLAAECEYLNARARPGDRYLPHAIGSGEKAILYRNNHAYTSSLYRPDLRTMNRYHNLSVHCQVESETLIETVRLDDIIEAHATDFLKLDVQGSELSILQNSTRVLAHALVVQTEVGFYPIYEGQPLFAQVDATLHAQGFMFHHFRDTDARALSAAPAFWDRPKNCRQRLWSDAVYIKDFSRWASVTSSQLMKFALIMCACYRAYDFTAALLREVAGREGRTIDLGPLFELSAGLPDAGAETDRSLQADHGVSEHLHAELLAKDEALGRAIAAAEALRTALLQKDSALPEAQTLTQVLNEQLLAKDTSLAEANAFLATFQGELVAKEHEIKNTHRILNELREATKDRQR